MRFADRDLAVSRRVARRRSCFGPLTNMDGHKRRKHNEFTSLNLNLFPFYYSPTQQSRASRWVVFRGVGRCIFPPMKTCKHQSIRIPLFIRYRTCRSLADTTHRMVHIYQYLNLLRGGKVNFPIIKATFKLR